VKILKIERRSGPFGKYLAAVLPNPFGEMRTMDDCFGMDRIKSWARDNGLEMPPKGTEASQCE